MIETSSIDSNRVGTAACFYPEFSFPVRNDVSTAFFFFFFFPTNFNLIISRRNNPSILVGRKKNSFLPRLSLSIFHDEICVRDFCKPIRMLFAAGRRVKKRFVSHPLPSTPPVSQISTPRYRGRGNSFVFVILAPNHLSSSSAVNRFSSSSVIEIQRSCLRAPEKIREKEKKKRIFVKTGRRRRRRRKVRWKVCGLINRRVVACSHERTNERPNRVCKVDIGSRIKHRWQTVPLMRRILEPDRTLLRPFPSNFWIRALNIYRPSYSQIHPPRRSLSLSLSISISVRIKESTNATFTILHLNKTKQFPGLCSRLKPIQYIYGGGAATIDRGFDFTPLWYSQIHYSRGWKVWNLACEYLSSVRF